MPVPSATAPANVLRDGGSIMADEFTLAFTGDQEAPPSGTAASGAGTVSWDGAVRTAS